MRTPLDVLIVEDSADDAELMLLELRHGGFDPKWRRVETGDALRDALAHERWDVVLWDYTLPGLSPAAALALLRPTADELPFIIVTGTIGEEKAVELIKAGAHDYLLKGHLARLGPAVARALRDTAERRGHRAAEERLQRSESLLAEAQELAHIGSWNWDLVSNAIEWSDEHYRIVGLRPQEMPITAERAAGYIHPDDRPRAWAAVNESQRSGQPYEWTLRMVREDGEAIVCQSRGRTAYDGQGTAVRMFGTIQDVTARVRTEEALRVANEQLDLAIHGSNLGIWDVDLAPGGDYRRDPVRFINVWEQLGYSPAEFPTNASASRALGHPDDLARVDAVVAACLAGETDEIRVENRIRHNDGSWQWLLTLGKAMRDASGKPVRLIGTVLDVTDRKRAEEAMREGEAKFRALAENVPLLVWSCTLDQKCDYVNPQVLRYTGQSEAELLGDCRLDGIHADDHAAMFAAWEQSMTTGEPAEFQARVRRHDGAWRWFQIRAAPIHDQHGHIIRWFGTNTDIDDLKRAEGALRQAKEAAERANRVKDEFLATLSHELRTPLAGILLWSQVLENGTFRPGDEGKALRAIRESAQVQQQLIEDLLDVSRLLAGEMRIDAREIELTPVVQAAVDMVRPGAEAKRIRIEETLDRHAGRVKADAGRMQQVVLNLLNNAVKFTPDGGRVSVRLRRAGAAGDVVEIQVSDTGQGIAPDFLPHVFVRFRQADGSQARQHGGLGLGLAIARELVELHGGTIRAESPGRDQGATFTIELPAIHARSDADVAARPPTPAEAAEAARSRLVPSPALRGVRVLLVEDEVVTRTVIQYLLEQCEAEVTAVDNAADALRAFETSLRGGRFDLLLGDIGLPEMNGYDMMRQMRSMEPRGAGGERPTPAVALTAYAADEDRAAALAAGFDTHLAKPVTAAALVDTVAKYVGRPAPEP